MDTEFWLERWRWREIGWHLDEINTHLQEHWPKLGLTPGTLVFVPLCGKTLDLIWLVSQGFRVIGVEISEIAVEEIFREHGLTPRITETLPFRRYQIDELTVLCGDFFDLTSEHLHDVGAVFDRASLIALPPELRSRYASQMNRLFPGGLDTLLVTLSYDQGQMTGPPFSVQSAEVEHLFSETYRIETLASFDALAESPQFRQRGLTALSEQVYRLAPLARSA
ncbi:thiopurine S-methyltransferase [Thiocystis violacea]|uniref:thiopurine S-methyltransferase n=1 Tax=Thiocystis violacea TaxID=13725 RepID=UPI0019046E8A|nr:thiopurine S-methyltransferase [Thiocystis violacea]MBK1722840.1 thiopurine S-methyltransferase [Thiocystis violacea]